MTTHNSLWLNCLTAEQRERTCAYWYTVTDHGSMPHTAFRRKSSLLRWLHERGLTIAAPLPDELGTHASIKIEGGYRRQMHMDPEVFDRVIGSRSLALSNGEYTLAVISDDSDGLRTVHTLNPNAERAHFDYRVAEVCFA